ncbi:acetyltransferase [Enterococcus sp. JM4C]|uniref:GNAT family N-acetyltransferase n=1 Tax=Candidatus Enterococcus huntleyi TaxID=1857217 RepID=UPI00137B4148|nr:GNAT family N-acetyltransferase [Enterococcus sp. JM4C]KAF1297355.1 acetyltransferase [Enterococcus sp. JM4C]
MNSRAATKEDYSSLSEIWAQSVSATHTFLHPADFLEIQKNLSIYFEGVTVKVWVVDEEIIGFTGTSGEHLEMLFLSPKVFRKGFGRQIVERLIAHEGITSVDVNEQNTGAVSFYESLGFEMIARDALDGQGKAYPILHLKKID